MGLAIEGRIQEVQPNGSIGRLWDWQGRFQDEWFRPELTLSGRHQTGLTLQYLWSRERFRETLFPGIRVATVDVNCRPNERIGLSLEIKGGRTIWRTFSAKPVLGRSLSLGADADLKLTQRLSLSPSLDWSRLRTPDDRAQIFRGYIARTRANYQIGRNLSSRLVVEYDGFDRHVRVEPLLTYRLNAFTVFFLGMADHYQQYELPFDSARVGDGSIPAGEGDHLWKLDSQQVFAKLQYMFRV